MKNKNILIFLLGFSLSLSPLFTAATAGADELPPPDGKPLSAILKSVEEQKTGVVTSAEFDDGWWEIETCQAGACQKLYIDPKSGQENRRRQAGSDDELPPAGALPLSAVVQSVEDRGLGVVTEAEFDDGFWEIELRRDGRKSKLDIDPMTGDIRR
jgi:uncharacterized membrane protein YkoI